MYGNRLDIRAFSSSRSYSHLLTFWPIKLVLQHLISGRFQELSCFSGTSSRVHTHFFIILLFVLHYDIRTTSYVFVRTNDRQSFREVSKRSTDGSLLTSLHSRVQGTSSNGCSLTRFRINYRRGPKVTSSKFILQKERLTLLGGNLHKQHLLGSKADDQLSLLQRRLPPTVATCMTHSRVIA